ncbi:NAD-dependent epimerase/dehydratase [Oscillochloris trichoides DG-6]|uniref:NAD-dependent epimerase/dehydratase n=1 Tax=Oscillochloris trichoides DG-6 TaxID=765420 RepID=E1IHW4_9CHLR|nr:NAD-dependent epimerase/dehydratase family protein [Oscillochloris trichoides]EFO79239.1 NAD-dependent epimerase/dehydratase [Oscillochloris trichoides DG-6]
MSNTVRRVLITGSSGLIGSEAVTYFDQRGWDVHGIDNNMRRDFFGPDGDTTWNLHRLRKTTRHFTYHHQDIRDRAMMLKLITDLRPNLIIHCASQPSHDLAKDRPFDDFDVNAVGTLNLLEATRRSCPEAPFIFMSTNKVYGDAPNELPLVELATRWEYARPEDYHGVSENCRIDACLHTLFGASKVAADILVQEYGRYFNMPTVCLRGGCLTGPNHAGVELHGFLSYLARAVREGRTYRIFGYKGKQVRDNIHSYDVCTFFEAFYHNPRIAAVYNLGGGRENSVSVIEAIDRFEDLIGKRLHIQYVDEHRVGDHICYISDMRRIHADYPTWKQEYTLERIFAEISCAAQDTPLSVRL